MIVPGATAWEVCVTGRWMATSIHSHSSVWSDTTSSFVSRARSHGGPPLCHPGFNALCLRHPAATGSLVREHWKEIRSIAGPPTFSVPRDRYELAQRLDGLLGIFHLLLAPHSLQRLPQPWKQTSQGSCWIKVISNLLRPSKAEIKRLEFADVAETRVFMERLKVAYLHSGRSDRQGWLTWR